MKKQKQPLTEKQIEAKRLYEKIIFVPMTEHESKPYKNQYLHGPSITTWAMSLCDINGRRFIKTADIPGDYVRENIIKLIEEGLVSKNDVIHTRANQPIFTIIALDVVVNNTDEFIKRLHVSSSEIDMFYAIIEGAKNAENVGTLQISEEELAASEEAFNERMRLITENARETRKQKQREALDAATQDEQPADEQEQPKDEPREEEEKPDGLKLAETLLSIMVENKQLRDKVQNYEAQLETYKKLVVNYDKIIANDDIIKNNLEAKVANLEEQLAASKQTTDYTNNI